MIGQIINFIVIFFRQVKSNFGKILLSFIFIVLFLFVLFPFSELNDLMTTQISKLSNNAVYFQFEQLHINPITTTVSVEKATLETPQISSLSADEISLRPALSAILKQKAGGHVLVKGIFKGQIEAQLIPTDAGKDSKNDRYKIEAQGQDLNLKDIRELANLPLPIKGQLQFNTNITMSLPKDGGNANLEQPEGDISVLINRFELPNSSLFLPIFESNINLPEIKLGQIEVKGKLSNGKLVIETGKIGQSKDELSGEIKGDLGILIQNINGQMIPILGSYNLSLELKATSAFKEKARFFLTFLDGYKKDLADGSVYKIRVQASAMGMPPQITPLQ